MRYIIVDHSDTGDLSNLVEELLNRGWKLHGGLVVSGEGNMRRFAQALTNEQDSDDESSSGKTLSGFLAKDQQKLSEPEP